jgi:hypothetical protein
MVRNESYWTRKLVEYLTDHHRKFVRIKIADHFTSGVPDMAIMGNGKTVWLELKVLKPGQSIVDRVCQDELQLYTMESIERERCIAWYMIFLPGDELRYLAVLPSVIRRSRVVNEINSEHSTRMDFKWVSNLFTEEY